MYIETLDKETNNIQAKMRAHGNYIDCDIKPIENNSVEVNFKEEQISIQPGQSIVFYKGDVIIGGGIISRKI